MDIDVKASREVARDMQRRKNRVECAVEIIESFPADKVKRWEGIYRTEDSDRTVDQIRLRDIFTLTDLAAKKTARKIWSIVLWTLCILCVIASATLGDRFARPFDSYGLGSFALMILICELLGQPGSAGVRKAKENYEAARDHYEQISLMFVEYINPLLSDDWRSAEVTTSPEMQARFEQSVYIELSAQKRLSKVSYPSTPALKLREMTEEVIDANKLSNTLWKINEELGFGINNKQGIYDKITSTVPEL